MEDTRLDELETRFAYLEKMNADLGELVYGYGQRLDRLEAGIKELARRLADSMEDKGSSPLPQERPPHY